MKTIFAFMLIAVAAGTATKDILSETSCRYLKSNGYLDNDPKWRPLCLKTYSCNDVFSSKSCSIAKARGECTNDTEISRMYCKLTCGKCVVSSCVKSAALGMESQAIPENRITASSAWPGYEAKYARLNHKSGGGWGPKQNSDKEWLQVDLGNEHLVTAIATQGSANSHQWMKSYTIQYSLDGSNFIAYQSGKVFTGNNDRHTVVKHDLKPPIVAQYIRVVPKTWYSWVVARMELYGCKA